MEWKDKGLVVSCGNEELDSGLGLTEANPLVLVPKGLPGSKNTNLFFEFSIHSALYPTLENQVKFMVTGRHDSANLKFQYDLIPWNVPQLLSLRVKPNALPSAVLIKLWIVKQVSASQPSTVDPSEVKTAITKVETALAELKLLLK